MVESVCCGRCGKWWSQFVLGGRESGGVCVAGGVESGGVCVLLEVWKVV